ncbi:MAG: hypothetical protein JW726_11760 [Anaerolineales bacterium]|nr:hypothetical protein [Anaerolineales bacterium]
MIDYKKTHWLLWPFALIWNLVAYILMLTGRFTAVILGLVLIVAGVILSATVVGACLGIPLALIGLLLAVRGLW